MLFFWFILNGHCRSGNMRDDELNLLIISNCWITNLWFKLYTLHRAWSIHIECNSTVSSRKRKIIDQVKIHKFSVQQLMWTFSTVITIHRKSTHKIRYVNSENMGKNTNNYLRKTIASPPIFPAIRDSLLTDWYFSNESCQCQR